MRLGVNLGYGGLQSRSETLALVQQAERLGYSVAWAAEAYGCDAPTVLGWLAGQTRRIDLGSAVMQIPARTPAMTAMTAATLDLLSDGRFRLGLGVSGPQVSEGWHGVRFDHPLARTREYVGIVRSVLRRETLHVSGEHWTLPLPDGPGKPLRLAVHPVRSRVPVYLAAVGPKNLALAGEIADGWLAVFFSPDNAAAMLEPLRAGRRRGGVVDAGFDIVPTVPVVVDDDVDTAASPVRAHTALYVGGMGSREQNFYTSLAARMGYEREARHVQDLYLDRRYAEAAAAVPAGLIDATSLIGPPARIRDRLPAFAAAGVTTLAVAPFGATHEARLASLRTVAEALDDAGLAE